MSAATKSAINVNAIGLYGQSIDAFLKQYRHVVVIGGDLIHGLD
jgi:hypothetical protein